MALEEKAKKQDEVSKSNSKKTIVQLIKSEVAKLKKIMADLPPDKTQLAYRIIEQSAFLYVTMSELKVQINKESAVELFENGKQVMLREHPAMKVYNVSLRNYTNTIKILAELSGEDSKASDDLMDYIKGMKKK